MLKSNADSPRRSDNRMDWVKFISSNNQVNLRSLISVPYQEISREIGSFLQEFPESFAMPRCPVEASKIEGDHVGFPVLRQEQFVQAKNKWSGIALKNRTGNSRHLIISNVGIAFKRDYRAQICRFKNHKWTSATASLPIATKFIQEQLSPHFRIGFVRVMILHPGGVVGPHCDLPKSGKYDDGLSAYNVLNSLHIAIRNPSECYFVHDQRVVPFRDGDLWWMNNSREHWAVNFSNEDRIHLIVHGMPNMKLRRTVKSITEPLPSYSCNP